MEALLQTKIFKVSLERLLLNGGQTLYMVGWSLLFGTVLPSPYSCEGGVPFLLLGLLLYAFRARREIQLGAYVLFSLGVYLLPALQSGCSVSLLLWGYYQWMMVFAVLPLACYNGVRGSAPRWLFYVFYPAHIYLLWALGALL